MALHNACAVKLSNCIVWALLLYLRRRAKGKPGYLMVRRSRFGKFPHVLYAERRQYGMRMVSFVPRNPRHKAVPPPMFHGKSKWGDLQ